MSDFDGYYYNKQLRSYLLQFMAVFAGMQVQVGKRDDTEPHLIPVYIKNASADRVVADIKSENTQNKPIRLPLLSAQLTNIELAPELRKGVGQQRRQTFMPQGEIFPDGINVVQQRMPVPYRAVFDLGIWASNQDQHYQILEQILMLFDPALQIQTSDEVFDWTKITTLELTGIGLEETIPAGADRRIIQTTLNFSVPIYLSVPVDVHERFVKDIYVRLGVVSQVANSSEDIVAELDAQGIEYDLNFSLDDIDLTP